MSALTGFIQVARTPPALSSDEENTPSRSRSTTVTDLAPPWQRCIAVLEPSRPAPTTTMSLSIVVAIPLPLLLFHGAVALVGDSQTAVLVDEIQVFGAGALETLGAVLELR